MTTFYLVMAIVFLGWLWCYLNGRIFACIPQNGLAGIFTGGTWDEERQSYRDGLEIKYVVGTQEDLEKIVPPGHAGNPMKGLISLATPIPLLTKWFNIRIFSFNPFMYIKYAEILRIRPATDFSEKANLGEQVKSDQKADALETDKKDAKKDKEAEKKEEKKVEYSDISDGLVFPDKPEWVAYLRIDNFVWGCDRDTELQGDKGNMIRISTRRMSVVRLSNPRFFYVINDGKYGTQSQLTLRTGQNNFMKTLTFDQFKLMDFSEQSKKLLAGIQKMIVGKFGITVETHVIEAWQLGAGQKKLEEIQIEKEIASERQEIKLMDAEGDAHAEIFRGVGKATAIDQIIGAYRANDVDGNVAAVANAEISGKQALASSSTIHTVADGIPLSLPLNASTQSQPVQQSQGQTQGPTPGQQPRKKNKQALFPGHRTIRPNQPTTQQPGI